MSKSSVHYSAWEGNATKARARKATKAAMAEEEAVAEAERNYQTVNNGQAAQVCSVVFPCSAATLCLTNGTEQVLEAPVLQWCKHGKHIHGKHGVHPLSLVGICFQFVNAFRKTVVSIGDCGLPNRLLGAANATLDEFTDV